MAGTLLTVLVIAAIRTMTGYKNISVKGKANN